MNVVGRLVRWPRSAALLDPGVYGTASFGASEFQGRERFRGNYDELCAALTDLIPFQSVLDLGCANGFLLEGMADRSKSIRGVEISPTALEFVRPDLRPWVTIGSATSAGLIGEFDLVTCIEVAEHVPPAETAGLLDTIARNARHWVYFTAASPYQPGHGHINCRPQFFWINEFRRRGFGLDWNLTEELIRRIEGIQPATWIPLNSLVFRRGGADEV
jgi:SAM-dependent methyltransferase